MEDEKMKFTISVRLNWRIAAIFPAKNSLVRIRIHGVVDPEAGRHPELPSGVRGQAHRVRTHA